MMKELKRMIIMFSIIHFKKMTITINNHAQLLLEYYFAVLLNS